MTRTGARWSACRILEAISRQTSARLRTRTLRYQAKRSSHFRDIATPLFVDDPNARVQDFHFSYRVHSVPLLLHFMGGAMDPARRGADRLARFYDAKRRILRPEVLSGRTVRSFAGEAGTASLRTLIAGSVVSFHPPGLPLHHGPVSCTHALAALHASGGFTFGVRVETSTPNPVAIVVGFCTNDSRGAWAAIIGALNFSSDSLATSRTSVGVFHTQGASWWLGRNFAAAASTGVTFRMVTDRPTAPIRSLFGSWVLQFGGQLVHRHLLAPTDDHPELSMQTLDVEVTKSIDPEDAQLRLRGSLIFE